MLHGRRGVSVCNLIVQPAAAFLITDSAYFSPTGEILGLAPKSFLLPQIPAAVAAVGYGNVPLHLHTEMQAELADPALNLATFMQLVRSTYDKQGRDAVKEWVRFVAAFYADGKPQGCSFFTNPEDAGPGQKPWTWYPIRALIMPYVDPRPIFGSNKIPLPDPAFFDPWRDAMKIVEVQREPRQWAHRYGVGVGGEIAIATVWEDGVEERVLHTYPDRVRELAGIPPSPANF